MLSNQPYKFKSGQRTRKVITDKKMPTVINPALLEPPVGLLQGQTAGSKEEWRVGLGLMKLKVPFDYQYTVFGGYNIRGGQTIDFLAYTVPLLTPIYVLGEYWHGIRQNEGELKLAMEAVKIYFNGQAQDPIGLWDYDLTTMDQTYLTLRREMRL